MEEGKDCDSDVSDSTVLLTDYVDKPEKTDIKRRRLSNVHDRGNQSEEVTAPYDTSVKGTGSAPEKKSNVYKKWHLKKYLESNNSENQLDIDDNVPNSSTTAQDSKGNSNNVDNDHIISLDSDDETRIDLSSHQGRKGVEKSARNDRVDLPKPARLTNRRATTGINGRNEVDMNSVSETREKHVKHKRRATVDFEQLLNHCNVNRKKGIPNTNTEREEERESDRRRSITLNLLQQSADVDTSNNSSAGCNVTGISAASLPTPRKPLKTHIARILQTTNTLINVKPHKRIGSNNEIQAEPKRIKMNKSTDLAQLIKNTASEVKNKPGAVNEKRASADTIDANSKSTANRVKKHRSSRDKKENTDVQDAEVIGAAHHKNAVNKAQDKQRISEVFDKKNASRVRDDQGATKALDEFGTSSVHQRGNSELHDKQEINKVQHDFGASKPQDEAHDEHELKKVQSEIKINKTNDQHETNKTLVETMSNQVQHKQVTSKILDNADASQSRHKVEINKVQNGHATSVNNDPKTSQHRSEACNNQEVSKVRENNVSEIQDKEDTQQINTEPKTSESRSVQETIMENGTTSKASDDGEDCDLILKFHVGFFTLVKENFKDIFPESAMELHNLIQTLITDTRNGEVQTDVKYCCPKCSRVSIYSSRIPNNEQTASADTKKCGFCKGIRELHTCYLMRYLSKTYTNNDKKEVTTIVSPGKDHAIQTEQSRDSLTGGIVISESQTTSEATTVNEAASLVAERDSTCSSIADNNKQVRNLTVTLESDSSNDTRINRAEDSDHCNKNTPEKPSNESTNKFQVRINSPDGVTQKVCLKPKINSDNIITTASKGIITSENMLNKKRQLEAVENDKEKKIASNNTPTGSTPETDEANAKQITDNKRNDQDNEGVIKPLLDCFTRIKNNLNHKEETPIKAQEENNLPQSTSNIQSPIRGGSNDSRDNFQQRDFIKIVYKYVCPICSTVHAHASRFLRHMNNDHDRNLTAIPRNCVRRLCPFCNILVLKDYNSHVKRTHPERFTENFNIAENTNNTNKIKPEKHCPIKNDIFLNRGNTGSNTISESTKSGDHCITPDKKLADISNTQHENRDDPPTTTSTGEITSENDTERCEESDKSSALKSAANSCNKEKRAPSDCNDENLDKVEHRDEVSLHNNNMHNINEKPTKANTSEQNINNRKDDGDHSSVSNDEYNRSKSSNNHGIDNDIPKLRKETFTASCVIENGKQRSPEPSIRYKSNDKQSTENTDKSQTGGSNICKEKEPDSEEECIKTSDNAIKLRKKRITKLFGDKNEALGSNKINEPKSNEDARSEHSSELPSRQKTRQTPEYRNTETERSKDKRKAVHKRRQATVEHHTESAESSDSDWVIRNDVSSDSFDELCPINQNVLKKLLIIKNKKGSNQSTETNENNDDSDDGTIKSSKYAVKKRKELLSKLFGDDNESSVSDNISEKDNRQARYEKSDKQRAEVEENEPSTQNGRNTESCYPETRNIQNVSELLTKHQEGNNQYTANDNNDDSDAGTIKTPQYAVEERLAKLFGDDIVTRVSDKISEKGNREASSEKIHSDRQSAGIEENEPFIQNGRNEKSCYPETRNMQNVSELLTKHQEGNNQYTSDDKNQYTADDNNDDSDAGTIKTSHYAVEERLSKLFGDDIETSVSYKISEKDDREASSEKKGERQSAEIEERSKESVSVNCGQEIPSGDETHKMTHTFKKRMDRISKHRGENEAVVQNSDSNQERANIGINNASRLPIVDEVRMEVNVSEKCVTETVEIPDKSNNGTNNENCVNEAEQETIRKNSNTDCDIHRPTDQTDITAVAEKEINDINTQNKSRDDEIEINMIDHIKMFDGNQRDASAEKGNDDNRISQVSGANSESVKTCLENIRITNVTSIQGKTHVFICQECNYATDAYDDVIRHCQHHYNLIQDQVTYCPVCQIHYDTICFERHQAAHDKYLGIKKIKFSYKWLFTNWQVVFENKDISLSESEYMQVKSIYKTLCVKMTVKEDGPWQSAVYLCAKCNTCVPALDVEKHVQLKCTFVHYPCHVCDRVFSTYELREHHEIYHADKSKLFKTVVFNDPNDESINAKLIQVKARSKDNKGTVDIFKCLCGLCFVSLKNFKLHFTDCDSETNGGNICPRCTTIRRFSTTELEEHLLRHHFLVNCEFRVQKIMFQLESIDSSEETPAEASNGNATHKWNVEDLNIKRDLLKDESLTQTDEENRRENLDNVEEFNRDQINERMPETSDNGAQTWSNEDLIIKRDMLKEESLTQSTDGEDRRENIDNVNEDIKRKQINETVTKTSDSTNNAAQIRTSNSIVKNVMLKETLTQNTNEANSQDITTGKRGIRVKGTQENKEIDGSKRADTNVSQEDMEVEQPVQPINTDSQEVVEVEPPVEPINTDSQEVMEVEPPVQPINTDSQEVMEVEPPVGPINTDSHQTDNPDTKASKETTVEPEQLITVEDSDDDDDVEFIAF